jgi:PAS domain S-box-containing protein
MIELVIIILSVLFQLSATILALKLISVTNRATAWLLLASAIALMTIRRIESLIFIVSGRPALSESLMFEVVGLALSALMFAGIYLIRPLFSEIVRIGEEHRAANERLKAVTEEQKLLLEHTLDFIYRSDICGNITYISPAVEKITGYGPDEWRAYYLGQHNANQANRADIEHARERSMTGAATPHRVEIGHKNGGTVWLEINKEPYFINGKNAGVIGVARDITSRVKMEEERENLIGKLQDALKNVRTMKGLLPICASCKKIRDDKGYWQQIEAFVRDHSDAEFSHGLCPDCAKKLYPNHAKHLP